MSPQELELISLTANDRCDRCIGQAYTIARKDGFNDLLFCNHHLRESRDALMAQGFRIIEDLTARERDGVLV